MIKNQCHGRLLDLGSGNGSKSKFFSEIGFDVTGLDGNSSQTERASSRYPEVHFVEFTINSELPFEDNSFDVIFSCSVFQYIKHPEMLRECKRILRKDGHIILIENLKYNPITFLGRNYLKLRKYAYDNYPWNHFTLKEIRQTKRDFEDSSVSVYHLLSPIAFLKPLKGLGHSLYKIDQWVLRTGMFKRLAWLVLFTAKNKKN